MITRLRDWLALEIAIANDRPGSFVATMERERWVAVMRGR